MQIVSLSPTQLNIVSVHMVRRMSECVWMCGFAKERETLSMWEKKRSNFVQINFHEFRSLFGVVGRSGAQPSEFTKKYYMFTLWSDQKWAPKRIILFPQTRAQRRRQPRIINKIQRNKKCLFCEHRTKLYAREFNNFIIFMFTLRLCCGLIENTKNDNWIWWPPLQLA